jgi:hypothetical protein
MRAERCRQSMTERPTRAGRSRCDEATTGAQPAKQCETKRGAAPKAGNLGSTCIESRQPGDVRKLVAKLHRAPRADRREGSQPPGLKEATHRCATARCTSESRRCRKGEENLYNRKSPNRREPTRLSIGCKPSAPKTGNGLAARDFERRCSRCGASYQNIASEKFGRSCIGAFAEPRTLVDRDGRVWLVVPRLPCDNALDLMTDYKAASILASYNGFDSPDLEDRTRCI